MNSLVKAVGQILGQPMAVAAFACKMTVGAMEPMIVLNVLDASRHRVPMPVDSDQLSTE
jgi:hypothetical protein